MRILDSKDPRDRPVADSAPDIDAFLTDEARAFFDAVTAGLDAAGVTWTRNPRLVRGLDYYRHTGFEFVTDRLGAQGTVLAGGRYDGLVESLGGPPTPGVGWAAGVERLAMLLESVEQPTISIAVVADNPDLEREATRVARLLRDGGITTDRSFRGNAKRQVEAARKRNLDGVLFVKAGAGRFYLQQLSERFDRDEYVREQLLPILGSFEGEGVPPQ